MSPLLLINPLPYILSLSATMGVVVHDLKIDQFTTTLLSETAIIASYEGIHNVIKMGDPHTHAERASISEFGRSLTREAPRQQPRNDHKKYRMENKVVKGYHPFDNYSLPVVA